MATLDEYGQMSGYNTNKALNGLAPLYLTKLLSHYHTGKELWSSDQGLLTVHRSHRTKCYGDRAFSIAVPKLWNCLPPPIPFSPTTNFRGKL